jgi:hypothetical protein
MDFTSADYWLLTILPGFLIGILFGFVLQRGRFCFYSAIRDPILLKDNKLLKGIGVALCVEMIGFSFFVNPLLPFGDTALLEIKKFFWLPQIVGGLIFGMGMVLAAGCASGTTYRVGEGMMGSLVALIGLTFGVYLVKPGGVLNSVNGAMLNISPKQNLTILGPFTDWVWLAMLLIGIIGLVIFIIRDILPAIKENKKVNLSGESIFKKGWLWWVSGIAIGIIAIIWLVFSPTPLGITGNWFNVGELFVESGDLTMGGWMVLGIIGGSMIAAIIAGEFKLRAPKEGKTLLLQFIGGVMLGVGAAFAGGCNIGNLLSGVPLLSVGSVLASVCLILGCWFMTWVMFMRKE